MRKHLDSTYLRQITRENALRITENKIIKYDYPCSSLIKDAIKDSYKRLIFPSIEREIRSDLTILANKVAIDNFSSNVSNLLLTPPMKEIRVLGFDPAFRTGCKLAVLDNVMVFSGMNMGLVLDAVMKGLNGKLELAEANDLIEAAKDGMTVMNGMTSEDDEDF